MHRAARFFFCSIQFRFESGIKMNPNTMVCSCCGETMAAGYVWLNAILAGSLEWSEQKPELAFWKVNAGDESIIDSTALVPAKSISPAHRCPSCRAVTIRPNESTEGSA